VQSLAARGGETRAYGFCVIAFAQILAIPFQQRAASPEQPCPLRARAVHVDKLSKGRQKIVNQLLER